MEQIDRYFSGVAWKYLSAVDAEQSISNQHELGGLVNAGFKRFLGDPGKESKRFPARFFYFAGEDDKNVSVTGLVTWYDARRDQPNRRPELRLYYVSNPVTEIISQGMFLLIAITREGELLLLFAEPGSSEEQQLRWLFGVRESGNSFTGKEIPKAFERSSWSSRWILDELGIQVAHPGEEWRDVIKSRFGKTFPTTRIFSEFAREWVEGLDPVGNPDSALILLMDKEEELFRALEETIVQEKLDEGFESVDNFISFSLSIQNRRKSRVGYALENHLEYVFNKNGIKFKRGVMTENRAKPDFLFPGDDEYHDVSFPNKGLAMLGAKSTCKDRWRQVLSEAKRIRDKHLITLEPGISVSQTGEMQSHHLQLVVPESVHDTYADEQQAWLWNVSDFVECVKDKQSYYLKRS